MKRSIITALVIYILMVSCRPARNLTTTTVPSSGKEVDYIAAYSDLAVSEMKRTGVPASITLAQGMIESGNGKSSLAVEANNHFGIKCHSDWKGPTVRHHDDRRNECFRKYKNPAESFRDHSDFLKNGQRYSFLFDLDRTDYKAWARGLKKAGYATNPDYADMLIRKIEQYRLYEFDRQSTRPSTRTDQQQVKTNGAVKEVNPDTLKEEIIVPVKEDAETVIAVPQRIKEKNRIQYIVVNERDTREGIEKEFKLLRWELPRYNELAEDFEVEAGAILYLQPKRDRAEAGKETHVVKTGETMYSISQLYGVKLRKLYEYNRMQPGSEPETGKKLWLRNMSPVN